MLRVGYLQFTPRFLDVGENYNRVLEYLEKTEADLVVLPELPFTGYNFETREQLERAAEIPAKSTGLKKIIKLCADKEMGVITGFAEKEDNKIYNSALFITGNGIEARYRKIHLFFREKIFFTPGNLPLQLYQFKGVRFGMMICFDWFFPEITRKYTLMGAQLICHPANLVLSYCQDVMISRSVENLIYIITANRIGTEYAEHGDLTFTGASQIVAPKGKVLNRGATDSEEVFVAEIDPRIADDKNITEMNNLLTDRRPDFY